MIAYERVYDITVLLGVESVNYPGDPPLAIELIGALADGNVADVTHLSMTAHAGTHVDAPGHFIAGGRKLADYEAGDFILPARVIDVTDPRAVAPAVVEAAGVRPGEAVLFRTANSTSGRAVSGRFYTDGVYVPRETAELCVERGVKLVGLDTFNVDCGTDDTFPAHNTLLGAGVLILETLNLVAVPAGEYTLICLPLKIHGSEGSPVRAVLLQ
jgi:arylformamidase